MKLQMLLGVTLQLSSSFESCDEGSDKSSDQRYSSQGESSSESRHSGKDSTAACDNIEPRLSTSHDSKIHRGQTSPEVSVGVEVETLSTQNGEPASEPSSNLEETPENLENPLPHHRDRAGVVGDVTLGLWSTKVKGSCTFRGVGDFQPCVENSTVDVPVLDTPGRDSVDGLEKFDGEAGGRSSPQRKPENLSLHGGPEAVRKPRKGTPVKVVSGPGGLPETTAVESEEGAQDMSFKGVRDYGTDGAPRDINPGQMLIRVPVFRCSSTTAASCDESSPPQSKDLTPLDLSKDRKRKPNDDADPQEEEDLMGCGPFEDYTVQILVLNGKEYEIIPLGNGRWLSRNEYELLKGLGPGEPVSHTNPRGTIEGHGPPVSSTAKNESNPSIRDFGIVESVLREECGPLPCDSKMRLELPDLVLAGKKPKLDSKHTAPIYGDRLFGDSGTRMENAAPSRSVFS